MKYAINTKFRRANGKLDSHKPDAFRVFGIEDDWTRSLSPCYRYLTPAETAAYLLGAPASSFPVDLPADDAVSSTP